MALTAEREIRQKMKTPKGFVLLCKLIGYPEPEILECLVNDHNLSSDEARELLDDVVVR